MIKPTEDVTRAIAQLSSYPAFDTFVGWLKDSYMFQLIKSSHGSGESIVKLAGGCLELEDLLKHINKTPEYVKNFRESK